MEGPVRSRDIITAIGEGVQYLVRTQNRDGSWGSSGGSRGFDLYAPVPGSHDGFRTATTALCVLALMEAKAPAETVRRGLEWLVATEPPRRPQPDVMYNVWAHVYAIQALAAAYEAEGAELARARIRAAAERHLELLRRYETHVGGWNYYDFDYGTATPSSWPTSFGTAAGLVAFFDAERAGLDIPEDLVRRATAATEGCRKPDGTYLYDLGFRYYPNHPINQDKGSLARMQSCNVALFLWGSKRVGKAQLKSALVRMEEEHRFLEIARKRQYPHEAYYYNSGYFYYFGHYYAARAIELLDPADRPERRSRLAEFVLPHQEADGSWWDYAMYSYHKPYGTAYALLTLLRCLESPYKPK
jgi:prenyltransferase/squalene oxidase-like repeat protein